MAKKIYIGEILGEVMSKVEALQIDMQSVANQMVDVAKNTSYLENLYLAVDRRSNVTYSSGDNTLAARLSSNLHTEEISHTNGAGLIDDSGGVKFNISSTPQAQNTTLELDVSEFEEVLFIPKAYADGNMTVGCYVDDVLIPDTDITPANPVTVGTRVSYDTSAIDTLTIQLKTFRELTAMSGYYALAEFYGVKADGTKVYLSYKDSTQVLSNKITIAAAGFENASFTLIPITGISIAQWDCLTWLISSNNIKSRIDILDLSGNLLLSDIKSGEALSELDTIDFYLRFFIEKVESISPVLEAVSYLYLT